MKYIRILVTKFIHQLIPHSILSGCEKHSVNIANFEDLSFLKRPKLMSICGCVISAIVMLSN